MVHKKVKILGKGNKERIVYLNDIAVESLKVYLMDRPGDSKALFSGQGTERLTVSGVQKLLKGVECRSGVEDCHPHRFRRTAASKWNSRKMPIQDIATLLGHASLNTTRIYMDENEDAICRSYYECQ